ncbi:MAG: signal peptide peptidase SppA [Crocinitomicaceae bacterium]|nr:signal peptide peptidase SppA [Crocinitomicaceae bacterium]
MTFWKTFWASLLASVTAGLISIGLFFIFLNALLSGFDDLFAPKKLVVEDNSVLEMDLSGDIGDYTYANFTPASFSLNKKFGVYEILQGLQIAKEDEKIKGIFLHCGDINAGMATVKEIRDGILDFKSSGKFVLAYSENYSKKAYYIASAADSLFVFPTGMVDFLGLGAEIMFVKGALEKLDVQMQIIRGSNNRFKSAVEPLMYEQMSPESKLQTQTYINALWDIMLDGISASRGISKEKLNEIADSVYVRKSGDAVDHGMADGIMYYDQVLDLLKTLAGTEEGEELALVDFQKYALKKTKHNKTLEKLEKKNLAIIFAEGDIVDGNGGPGEIGGNSLAAQIREVREDTLIKAVVLRINSPGGSALASDIIWREVILTKEQKPFIVSMGDVAASGGYYIACAADKIFAQPNTITGSIGVFGVIPFTGDMFKNKLGITFDHVTTNEHAILSTNRKLTDAELLIFQEGVDDIYLDFISKVGQGRGLTNAEVDSIGQGRVWAGTDAKRIGLVDEFGGLFDAIYYAAGEAGIDSTEIQIKVYPEREENDLFEFLENMDELDQANLAKNNLETQLLEIYNYIRTLDGKSSIQARLPYMIWIN